MRRTKLKPKKSFPIPGMSDTTPEWFWGWVVVGREPFAGTLTLHDTKELPFFYS